MQDHTSASLIGRVRDPNDAASWREFEQLYSGLIARWLARQSVHGQDADDITQEVMTYVFRSIGDFQHNGRTGAFRNWLRQITSNRLREFWRSRKRHHDGPDLGNLADQLEDEHSGVSRIWREEYDRYVVEQLIALVSPQFQESSLKVFREVVLEQRPAQDVADELGMSLGAVRVAQSRVLRALREIGQEIVD